MPRPTRNAARKPTHDDRITVRGARVHNLKDVSLSLPRDSLVVFTGVSGSGKSSLAFDTIYAEGQRRYVESLSAYARQFLEMAGKPDVDGIDGLSPAISIEQKTTSKNPRSTVATVTEIHDYMRLLWARAGVPHSPATGLPIESQAVSQMVDRVVALPEGTRFLLLAPVVRERKGEFRKEIAAWRKDGYQRLRVDGVVYPIDEVPDLDRKLAHDIEVVVDRLAAGPSIATRLGEGFETALALSDGVAYVDVIGANADVEAKAPKAKGDRGKLARRVAGELAAPERIVLSSRFACPVSGFALEEVEPNLFSFNKPSGACPTCAGLGYHREFDAAKVVPDPDLPLADAVAPWRKDGHPEYGHTIRLVAKALGVDPDTRWKDLPARARKAVLDGTPAGVAVFGQVGRRAVGVRSDYGFQGVMGFLHDRYRHSENSFMGKAVKEDLDRFRTDEACAACAGMRLRPEALCVKVGARSIGDVSRLSVRDAAEWFSGVPAALDGNRREIAARILKEISDRLRFLLDVGLDYLTLDRESGSLSGGESQRIRLASQIGSGLTGVLYVLDEPSIGLHQRDNDRLLSTLRKLRDLRNTVIVVEHDEDAIMAADHVVDVGPGAGVEGGRVVSQGTPLQVMRDRASLTGRYLSGYLEVSPPRPRRRPDPARALRVVNARGNNLKGIDVSFPLGLMTVVAGVSGGGKSTLVLDTLYRAAARRLSGGIDLPAAHDAVEGLGLVDKVVDIDQSPIGRTPRSNPATYVGAFGPIRDWFTNLPEAKARGYKPGRFSFNVKGGRCEACEGDGVRTIAMHFLPDMQVTCEVCEGSRFGRETLEVLYRGHSIADVLAMPVSEAHDLFKAVPAIRDKLATLVQVGLGYVKVGQPATTLSGGEAQRVKLAKELSRRSTGKTLYVLDEPTTGLHFHDIRKLLELLQGLVDQGNTVVVIEHNLEVVAASDWVIDMGPEGGGGGGRVLAEGTPEEVAARGVGPTAPYLAQVLSRRRRALPMAAE